MHYTNVATCHFFRIRYELVCRIVGGGCTLPDGTPEHGPARVARQ